jgi:tetratricopeptide (TPR) repeat protein
LKKSHQLWVTNPRSSAPPRLPTGSSTYCPYLWQFASNLKQDSDKLQYQKRLLNKFFGPFRSSFQEKIALLDSRYSGLSIGQPYVTGSIGNQTAIDESDFDILVPISVNNGPFRYVHNSKAWSSTSGPIDGAICTILSEAIKAAVESFLEANPHLGFELLDRPKEGKKCVYSWQCGVLEFDLLFALQGHEFFGIIGTHSVIRSDNPFVSTAINDLANDFDGFREFIRVLKWIAYKYKTENSEFYFPSCGFEAIMMQTVNKVEYKKEEWNKTSFGKHFRGCLLSILSCLECNTPLPIPNDPDENIMNAYTSSSDPSGKKRAALESFVWSWTKLSDAELLTTLNTATQSASLATPLDQNTLAPLAIALAAPSSSSAPSVTRATPEHAQTTFVGLQLWNRESQRASIDDALTDLRDCSHVNCIAVFGTKGTGKSFLLNSIAKIAGAKSPVFESKYQPTISTTRGVNMVVLPSERLYGGLEGKTVLLDVEGTGMDSSVYQVLVPAALASHVIIYNCGPVPLIDYMLTELTLFTNLAHKLNPHATGISHLFGQLLVVLRDATPDMEASLRQLLDDEPEPTEDIFMNFLSDSSAVKDRNLRRQMVRNCFKDISFFCLPAPAQLSSKDITFDNSTVDFHCMVQSMLDKCRPHLTSTLPFMPDITLTGRLFHNFLQTVSSPDNLKRLSVASLISSVHDSICNSSFERAIAIFDNKVKASLKLPCKQTELSRFISDAEDEALEVLLGDCRHLPEYQPVLNRLKTTCREKGSTLEQENKQMCDAVGSALINDIVLHLLRQHFQNLTSPEQLQLQFREVLDAKVPPYLRDVKESLHVQGLRALGTTAVLPEGPVPDRPNIRDGLFQVAYFCRFGKIEEAREIFNQLKGELLKIKDPTELVEHADLLSSLVVQNTEFKPWVDRLLHLVWTLCGGKLANCPMKLQNDRVLPLFLAKYLETSDSTSAEALYLAAAKNAHDKPGILAPILCSLGQVYHNQGRVDEAKRCAVEAVEALPEDPDAVVLLLKLIKDGSSLEAAQAEAQQRLPALLERGTSPPILFYAVQKCFRKEYITAEFAEALLLRLETTIDTGAYLYAFRFHFFRSIRTGNFDPLCRFDMDRIVDRAMTGFLEGHTDDLGEAALPLGLYWWKFAPTPNQSLAKPLLTLGGRASIKYALAIWGMAKGAGERIFVQDLDLAGNTAPRAPQADLVREIEQQFRSTAPSQTEPQASFSEECHTNDSSYRPYVNTAILQYEEEDTKHAIEESLLDQEQERIKDFVNNPPIRLPLKESSDSAPLYESADDDAGEE